MPTLNPVRYPQIDNLSIAGMARLSVREPRLVVGGCGDMNNSLHSH